MFFKIIDFPRNNSTDHFRDHYVCGNTSSRFSNNTEANASELLENLEEMFPHYCL